MLGVVACMCATGPQASAGEVDQTTDESTGWQIYTLRQGNTTAQVAPAAGCNVFSIRVNGVEYLRVPDDRSKIPGVGYGTPILYPTPNRVRGGQFTFDGTTFRFQKNSRGNFIHGLVHSVPWKVVEVQPSNDKSRLVAELQFTSDNSLYQKFPLEHTVRVTVTVTEGKVQWDYLVDNTSGRKAVPFGFALHPYFVYQGERAQTFMQVPATHWMEAENLLPSGRLIPVGESRFDLRQPTSLAGMNLDDVFFGMSPASPVVVDFRDRKRRITLAGSEEFTHLVVFTPDRPYFCVENQTCSTDAHNLANAGKQEAAHLQACGPGQSMTGSVWYRFE